MQKIGWRTYTRGGRGLAVLALALLLIVAGVWFPRGLRGPDSVAQEFLDTLIRMPDDVARLRSAGHLRERDDPRALIDALPTRVALDYLHARENQGMGHEIRVTDRPTLAPPRYAVVLQVGERDDRERVSARRFRVDLQRDDNGDWRVTAVDVVP